MRKRLREAQAMVRSEEGVTTVEYAVMLVMVALAVIALGTGIAGSVTTVFNNLVAQL